MDGSNSQEEEPLDVLDLPQIHQRPSAPTLLMILSDLTILPLSWDKVDRVNPKIKANGVPAYLTAIISSPLAWVDDDELKEEIWEEASKRLSERSGRTGMGSITRTFKIPLKAVPLGAQANGSLNFLELVLHEPALTADNLGLKTWASSYVLAKRLALLRDSLPRIRQEVQILELGSGTGLVGLAAAAVFGANVVLTDLPEIIPNLRHNVASNTDAIAAHGGRAEAAVLDWMEPSSLILSSGTSISPQDFPVILAADPIYSPDGPRLVVQTVQCHLSRVKEARLIIEMPLRHPYAREREDLRLRLIDLGLVVLEEGEDVGYDDWMDGDKPALVRCGWNVWSWKQESPH